MVFPLKIIRYYGSKGSMWKSLLKHFPTAYGVYIEPFGGSATMLFCQRADIEVYNDLEQNVYSLFKVVSDEYLFYHFKERLDLTPYSEQLRAEYKERLKLAGLDVIDRAYYFFYVNMTSVNGLGGLSIHTTAVRRKMSKGVSDYLSKVDGLLELHQRLSSVMILNRSAFDILERYQTPETFYYLDPPYHQTTRTGARYAVDFSNKQHEQLIDTIINHPSMIMLSGYDCAAYDRLLTNERWQKYSFQVNTISAKRIPKTKTETIWINYPC